MAAGLFRAVVQIAALPIGRAQQLRNLGGPAASDPFCHRVALFRRADRRLQHIGQRHAPVPLQQIAPTRHRAGDAHGVAGKGGHPVIALSAQRFNGGPGGGAPGTIQRRNTFCFCIPIECKTVTTNASHNRLHHVEHGCRGNGGISGVATCLENVQPGHGGQWLAGGDHAVTGQYVAAT